MTIIFWSNKKIERLSKSIDEVWDSYDDPSRDEVTRAKAFLKRGKTKIYTEALAELREVKDVLNNGGTLVVAIQPGEGVPSIIKNHSDFHKFLYFYISDGDSFNYELRRISWSKETVEKLDRLSRADQTTVQNTTKSFLKNALEKIAEWNPKGRASARTIIQRHLQSVVDALAQLEGGQLTYEGTRITDISAFRKLVAENIYEGELYLREETQATWDDSDLDVLTSDVEADHASAHFSMVKDLRRVRIAIEGGGGLNYKGSVIDNYDDLRQLILEKAPDHNRWERPVLMKEIFKALDEAKNPRPLNHQSSVFEDATPLPD